MFLSFDLALFHGYSISSRKHCIGYLRHSKNGMSHIILTISSLSSHQTSISTQLSAEFDHILAKLGLSKATEKDADDCIIVHLGFEFDSIKMQVSLPPNKKHRALDAINSLLSASTVSLQSLESTLGFLSHCCQVVPLGRPFLRQLFSLLCHCNGRRRFRKIRIPRCSQRRPSLMATIP